MPHRYIYMQAFWSLIWNHMASLWVEEHGVKRVRAGDLVVTSSDRSAATGK
jgi:hypothetical protein